MRLWHYTREPFALEPRSYPQKEVSASEQHNAAMLPLLRMIAEHADTEVRQWVILESLCLGIGKLHGRSPAETALFVENIAERLVEGARP